MNGKVLKVVEYNLTFGATDRYVNVYGVFKYTKNNNLYIIYSDPNPTYNYISYGSSYIKNNSILSLATTKKEEEEIVKEYIFKIINQEPTKDFEFISLDSIEEIEIIGSNKIEVKEEVLKSLINLTIPKPKKEEIENQSIKPKKKKFHKITFLLLIILIGGSIYFFMTKNNDKTTEVKDSIKTFICTKEYQSNTLDAKIKEENTYHFSLQENLEYIEGTKEYQFSSKDSYQDFIQNGTFNKYIEEDEKNSSFSQDEENNIFKTNLKTIVDSSYSKPTNYEEALSREKADGYSCQERLGQ